MLKKELSTKESVDLLDVLKKRFEKNSNRHKDLEWNKVQKKLEMNSDKLWSLHEMESTGGEPDVINYDKKTDTYLFCDCSVESPKGRRSLCYDLAAWESRKTFKPATSALEMATAMGVEILSEEQYRALQELGEFDLKTSSWIATPVEIRKRGGAIFADRRYNHIFVYHNGAESYYAARGFRSALKV